MAKKNDRKIKLKSSESAHCYWTTKNKVQTPDRLVLRKFDPMIRKHCEYKEAK